VAHAWSDNLVDGLRPRRILVVKWSAMGDVVIATATLQDLHDAFPQATIDLDVQPPWEGLFAGDPRIARILGASVRERRRRLAGTARWLREVRAGAYDLIVDLQSNDHTRLLLCALRLGGGRVPRLAGYHRHYPYHVAPHHPARGVHVHERARATLQALGVEPRCERPVLHVPEADRDQALRLRARHDLGGGRYVAFLPGSQSAGYLKRWGAERYARLAHRLHARGIDRVLLLGGPDEIEECARIADACGPWLVNLCNSTSIRALVPLCEGAAAIVANDTGTAHVAAAAGVPMLVVCGPTDPRRVKPLGACVESVQVDLPCINCYRKHCAHHACMRLLSPALVAMRVEALLAREPGGGA
jgi:heptosyltransferase-2